LKRIGTGYAAVSTACGRSSQTRKQSWPSSLAARAWSGSPNQSVHPSCSAFQRQFHSNSISADEAPAAMETRPRKYSQPDSASIDTRSIGASPKRSRIRASVRSTFTGGRPRGKRIRSHGSPLRRNRRSDSRNDGVAADRCSSCSVGISIRHRVSNKDNGTAVSRQTLPGRAGRAGGQLARREYDERASRSRSVSQRLTQ